MYENDGVEFKFKGVFTNNKHGRYQSDTVI